VASFFLILAIAAIAVVSHDPRQAAASERDKSPKDLLVHRTYSGGDERTI